MPVSSLHIIGESINDSVPSTNAFYESGNFDGIAELARFQEEKGAAYIDVNVGGRTPDVMKLAIETVQSAVHVPLSIDSPDYALAEAGLLAYDDSRGKPILNSISPLRPEMFELYRIKPFRPILLVSEYCDEQGNSAAAHTAEETFAAVRHLFGEAKKFDIPNDDLIFDPGIAPIGTDSEGNLPRLIKTLEMIQADPELQGVHASVGLSNFTVMLPPRTKTGELVKSPLESAFLTFATPLGLDYVIGSVKRNYSLLPEDHPAMTCLRDCLASPGFQAVSRVRKFYR